jgi:hypothetical protein
MAFGVEITGIKNFIPRAGYRFTSKIDNENAPSENLRGLSAGFGLSFSKFNFNYALGHYGSLGLSHTFQLSTSI